MVSVPQTDTGRWVEYTKALGRTLVKELGNTADVTSGYVLPAVLRTVSLVIGHLLIAFY